MIIYLQRATNQSRIGRERDGAGRPLGVCGVRSPTTRAHSLASLSDDLFGKLPDDQLYDEHAHTDFEVFQLQVRCPDVIEARCWTGFFHHGAHPDVMHHLHVGDSASVHGGVTTNTCLHVCAHIQH